MVFCIEDMTRKNLSGEVTRFIQEMEKPEALTEDAGLEKGTVPA